MAVESRIALVTGAAKRIGRAIAVSLAEDGCDVAIHCNTSPQEAEVTAGLIRERGRRTVVMNADLADAEATAALADRAAEALGGLNILVNNASEFVAMKLDDFRLDAWNATLAVNLTAPMVLSHAAYPHLRARGGQIVNLLDISAGRPGLEHLAYSVAKAGLWNLTLALAKAMAPDVRVNGIAPGAALLPEGAAPADLKAITRRVPAMRMGTVEEIAAAVRFMACHASYVTGSVLNVDGGRSIAW